MRVIIFKFIFFVLFICNAKSQTKTLDSLRKVFYKNYDSATADNIFTNASYEIKREEDDFTKDVRFYTPLLKSVSLTKFISKGKTHYYLSLSTHGSTLNFNIRGVYVLFADKTKWNRLSEKIDLDYDDGYEYSAFIELTPNELKLFQTKPINKFRLYIYDEVIDVEEAEKFMLQSNFIQLVKK